MTEAQAPERQFAIQRIYTKDVSFETPNSPAVFTQEWKPEVNVNLNSTVNEIDENNIEVTLSVTVTAKLGEQTAYLAEVQQAGIFLAAGIPDEEKGPLTGIYCPNVLFPYVRETISDLVTRGSFPQFLLQQVNFEAIYAQRMQQMQAEAGSAPN
ncbi:MAG: protein-export chaperone SecB [bacterium]